MGRVCLGEIAFRIEQKSVSGASRVGLELGENRGQLITAVDVLVENVCEGAPDCRSVENEA